MIVLAIIGIIAALIYGGVTIYRFHKNNVWNEVNYPYQIQIIEIEGQRFAGITRISTHGFEVVPLLSDRKAERE